MKAISDEGQLHRRRRLPGLHPARDLADGAPARAAHRHRARGADRPKRAAHRGGSGARAARHPGARGADAAEEEVAAIAGLRSGRVRMMAFPSASATLVPRALSLVKQRFPDVNIKLHRGRAAREPRGAQGRRVRLAVAFAYEGTDLGRGEEDLDQFVITPLLDDEVRLARPPAVAGQQNVDLADLAGEPGSQAVRAVAATCSSSPTTPASGPTSPTRPRTTSPSWGWWPRASGWRSSRPHPAHGAPRCVVALPITPASRRSIMADDLGPAAGPVVNATLEVMRERPGAVDGADDPRPGAGLLDRGRWPRRMRSPR